MLRVGEARQPWIVVHLGEGNSEFKTRVYEALQPWLATHIVVVPRRNQLVTQDVNRVDE